jgi:hypothetical protein
MIFSDPDDGEMPEISATLDQHRIGMHLMCNHMVMPSKYEIDSLDLLRQFDIVVLHHVRECDDDVAFHLVSEFVDHLVGEVDEGNAVADLLVVGVEGVDPLLLRQTEVPDLQSFPLHCVRLQTFRQSPSCPHVVHVAQ